MNPETKGPVGDSHLGEVGVTLIGDSPLGEVGVTLIFTLKSAKIVRSHLSQQNWTPLHPSVRKESCFF